MGAAIGSFVNVVALRHNTGMSISTDRSQCFHCGVKLTWQDLVPFFSFFLLVGKCRYCNSKISWRYPLVELVSGLMFLFVALRQYALYQNLYAFMPNGIIYSLLFFVYYTFIFSLLLAILLYDIKHKIIPDNWVYLFITLSVGKLILFLYINGFFTNYNINGLNFWNLLAPIVLSLPFYVLWKVSDGLWIGFGDIKFIFGIGALLGLPLGLSAVTIAFWVGALVGIFMMIGGNAKMRTEVPFGPFLVLGTVLSFLLQIDIFHISQFLSI